MSTVQATAVGSTIDENGNVNAPTWTYGLCDFCALPTLCINVWCCSACILAQTAGRAKEYVFVKDFKTFLKMIVGIFVAILVFNAIEQALGVEIQRQVMSGSSGSPTGGTISPGKIQGNVSSTLYTVHTLVGLIGSFFAFMYLIITFLLRLKVRAQKNIPPNLVEDVVCTVCCPCCVVIQTAREVGVGEECMNMKDPNNDPNFDGSATGFDKV